MLKWKIDWLVETLGSCQLPIMFSQADSIGSTSAILIAISLRAAASGTGSSGGDNDEKVLPCKQDSVLWTFCYLQNSC